MPGNPRCIAERGRCQHDRREHQEQHDFWHMSIQGRIPCAECINEFIQRLDEEPTGDEMYSLIQVV